jgi:hypothetical protein
MITYRCVGYSTVSESQSMWVDLLPPLCLQKKVLVKLFESALSSGNPALVTTRHLLSETLTLEMYRLYEPIKPVHNERRECDTLVLAT